MNIINSINCILMKIKINSSSVLCSIPAVPPCHPGPGVVVLLRPGDGGPARQAGVQGGEHAGENVEEIRHWNWAIIEERESVHKSILPGLSTHSLSSRQARQKQSLSVSSVAPVRSSGRWPVCSLSSPGQTVLPPVRRAGQGTPLTPLPPPPETRHPCSNPFKLCKEASQYCRAPSSSTTDETSLLKLPQTLQGRKLVLQGPFLRHQRQVILAQSRTL